MPEIELDPHEYRSQRGRRNANAHGLMALAAIGFLGWFWTGRTEVSPETLFGVSAMFGAFAGAGLIVFFNQWRGI